MTVPFTSLPVSTAGAGGTWVKRGREVQRENEIGVSGRIHFLVYKKKMEVQSLEFRLSDHETKSAEAEGPGS